MVLVLISSRLSLIPSHCLAARPNCRPVSGSVGVYDTNFPFLMGCAHVRMIPYVEASQRCACSKGSPETQTC